MRILRQVEAGRPVVEAAQNEMLDGVEPDRAQSQGPWIAPRTWASRKSSRSRKTCTYSRVTAIAQPGLQEPPQPEKLVWQRPPGQRRRLIERARLALQQGQVVQRIEDQLLTPVAATMTGDLLTPADDHDDVHVALQPRRGGRRRLAPSSRCGGSAPATTNVTRVGRVSQASYGTGGNGNNAARSRAKRSPIVSVSAVTAARAARDHWRAKSAFNASQLATRGTGTKKLRVVADQPFHLALCLLPSPAVRSDRRTSSASGAR